MKFTDALDANGASLQGAALFAARADHWLEWEDADQQAVWQAALPELYFFTLNGLHYTDVFGLAPMLALVTIHCDAMPAPFYARQLAPAAWGRFLGALSRMKIPAASGLPTACWLRLAETALLSAPSSVLDDLTLLDSDLLDTEVSPAGPVRGQATAPQVMKLITWGDLTDSSNRLLPAGDMLYYVNNIWRIADRDAASAWHSTAAALRTTVVSGSMCSALDHSSDQVAEFVAVFIETAWPPELRTIAHSPNARAQCLRLRLTGGQDGADPRRTRALTRRIEEALVHFPPVRALMENAIGHTLVHGTELVSALRDAALLLDPSVASLLDTFGISISALRRLNRALEGHTAFLAQQSIRAEPPEKRLEAIVQRTAATATAASSSTSTTLVRHRADGAPSWEEDPKQTLAGVPRHFQRQLTEALQSALYLRLKADILGRLGGVAPPDEGVDILWTATSGDTPISLAVLTTPFPSEPPDQRNSLMWLYAQGVVRAEAADAELGAISAAAGKAWPALLARQLSVYNFPDEEASAMHPTLKGATVPLLSKVLLSSDWEKIDILGAVKYLRALRMGSLESTELEFARPASSTAFGEFGSFMASRISLGAVLSLFGHPDSTAPEGWGAALMYADKLWAAHGSWTPASTQMLRTAIARFVRGVITSMCTTVVEWRASKNPLHPLPARDVAPNAWAQLRAVGKAITEAPNMHIAAVWATALQGTQLALQGVA